MSLMRVSDSGRDLMLSSRWVRLSIQQDVTQETFVIYYSKFCVKGMVNRLLIIKAQEPTVISGGELKKSK